MKISELMAGVTPNASYEGWVTADDWVLAIDTKSWVWMRILTR